MKIAVHVIGEKNPVLREATAAEEQKILAHYATEAAKPAVKSLDERVAELEAKTSAVGTK